MYRKMKAKILTILSRDGFLLTFIKSMKYIYMRITSQLNTAPTNSKKYWDYRMKYNWDIVGGEINLYILQ